VGRSQGTQAYKISAPLGGLNVRDPENRVGPNEALALKNYYALHSSIRAVGNSTQVVTAMDADDVYSMTSWSLSTGAERIVAVAPTKIYLINSSYSVSDITGSGTISNNAQGANCQFVPFSNRLFIINQNNNDDISVIDRTGGAATLAAFTGPSSDDKILGYGWAYKGRLYFIEGQAATFSSSFWYAGLGAVTGSLTEVDLAEILQDVEHLMWGASWSFNQGGYNEELCVIGTYSGELLIYSGDNPAADNWELVIRAKIPRPIGRRAIVKIGSDLAIATVEGIILLSQALSANATPASLYTVTDKVRRHYERGGAWSDRNTPQDVEKNQIILSTEEPFLYTQVKTLEATIGDDPLIFALNLRTGGWSSLTTTADDALLSICFAFGDLHYSTPDNGIYILESSSTQGDVREWATGWLDLGISEIKSITYARLFANHTALSSNASTDYTLTINRDYKASGINTVSKTATMAGSASTEMTDPTEFEIGITGRWFQFVVTADNQGIDEITELEIEFEVGGGLN